MRKKTQRIVELKINTFSRKGGGLAPLNPTDPISPLVETSFTVPGDVILAELGAKQKGVHIGKLQQVVRTSPDRISVRCPHFGECGGCRLQHISYEHQLKHKESFTYQCFKSFAAENVSFNPIVGCDTQWGYRNKMEYTFSMDSSGNKYLGLMMYGNKRRAFNIRECHLVNSWFTDTVKSVKQWWDNTDMKAYHHSVDIGSLKTLTLREGHHSGDRMVILMISGDHNFVPRTQLLQPFIEVVRNAAEPSNGEGSLSILLRLQQVSKGHVTTFYDMPLYGSGLIREKLNIQVDKSKPPVSLAFDIGPSEFFQPNTKQAEKYYSLALSLAKTSPDAVVYDLFCGAGTLGLSISKYVKQVVGIEISPESSERARTNAIRNDCKNITIFSGAVRHLLNKLTQKDLPCPDIAIINPPRMGLDKEAILHLLELHPPKILYISCDPAIQARDVQILLENGYRLVLIQPVDLFPHTYHVENIALLERTIDNKSLTLSDS